MAKLQYIKVAVLLCLLLFSKVAVTLLPAKESLLKSVSYFDKGSYKKALDAISHVNIKSDFDNSDDMKLALKIRAIAYEQTGNIKSASETIRELFFIDPNYKFDPFETPASVVELAQKEKALIDEKNKYLATIKDDIKKEQVAAIETLEKTIFVEKKPHVASTLFPMGINHFYVGATLKGGVYLSIQALSLALNVASFWWKQSYLDSFGSSRLKHYSYQKSFETAQVVQFVSLGALIIGYSISIVDALLHFK